MKEAKRYDAIDEWVERVYGRPWFGARGLRVAQFRRLMRRPHRLGAANAVEELKTLFFGGEHG